MEGEVSVSYVYGKPVEGFVTFKFGYGEPEGEISFIGKSRSKELAQGKSDFSFEVNQFYIVSPSNLLGKRFVVEVEVNEFETGKKFKKQFAKGLFSKVAFKFAFDGSIKTFKPGFENKFIARLFYADGRVAPNVPVNVDIAEINLVKRLTTNEDGYLNVSFIAENNLDQVTVNLKTSDQDFEYLEQVSDSRVLMKQQSATGGYLSVNKPYRNSFKVGEQFETSILLNNIDHSQFASFNYYLISPSGNLIDAKRFKYFETIKFQLKNEHHPQVTLAVIGYPILSQVNNKTELKTNDIILTDTIQINVNLVDDCGIKTNLFVNDKKFKDFDLSKVSVFRPGTTVSLEFNSIISQQLSLIGVDEAVYSLSSNTLLARNKLKQLYQENTLVCGEGGYSYSDVLLNSGLILFDPDTATNHNPVSSMCKGYVQPAVIDSKKANGGKNSKKGNRIKRDIDVYQNKQVDYNYLKDKTLKQCCLLGAKMTDGFRMEQDTCTKKLSIFKKRVNDTACIQAFINCCFINQVKLADNQRIQPAGISTLGTTLKINMKVDFNRKEFIHIADDNRLEKSTYIREDFRETWLFDIYPLEKNKPTNLTFKLPDSITTQSLSTFALSKETGICFFEEKPIKFLTFQNVFVQVLLPYQAVQNEQLEMVITVFNYNSIEELVILYFYGIEGICSEAEADVKSERKSLAVPPNSSKSVTVPLVPLKTGKFKIKIVALNTGYTDIVIKELDVIPQGVPVEDEYAFQLDPKNKQKRSKRQITTDRFQDKIIPEQQSQFTKLKLSPNQKSKLIVPNSEHCIISAIADEYGPAMAYSFPDSDLVSNEINRGSKSGAGSSPGLDHLIRVIKNKFI